MFAIVVYLYWSHVVLPKSPEGQDVIVENKTKSYRTYSLYVDGHGFFGIVVFRAASAQQWKGGGDVPGISHNRKRIDAIFFWFKTMDRSKLVTFLESSFLSESIIA